MPPRKRAAPAAAKKAAPRRRASKKTTSTGTQLGVVDPDAMPAAKKPKVLTLLEAIETGDYLEILRAQRRELVTDMRGAAGPAKAAMHRQFALLSKEITGLEAAAKEEADEDADAEIPDEEFDSEAL